MQPPPICTETLVKYMLKVTEVVEKKIEKELPSLFALAFDGWSNGSNHFVATFASFTTDNDNGYKQVLLSFLTLEDETTQSADEHCKHLDYVLRCYNKSWSNFAALIGDNCSVNKRVATNCSVPLIGCASHRYNLAVQTRLAQNEPLLEKIHKLMTKLKHGLSAAKLRRLTPLAAVNRNKTRWSSSFDMLKR